MTDYDTIQRDLNLRVFLGQRSEFHKILMSIQSSVSANQLKELVHGSFAIAVSTGSLELVQWFVEEFDVDICRNYDNVGGTYLHIACEECDLPMTQYLLSKGANANAMNNEGKSPMYTAFAAGFRGLDCIPTIQWLHSEASVPLVDERGYSLLMQACAKGESAVINWILDLYCESSRINLRDPLLEYAQDRGSDQSMIWHAALENQQWDAAECFLYNQHAFALIHLPNNSGNTPLHTAILHHAPAELCMNMINFGDARLFTQNQEGKSCLDLAQEVAFSSSSDSNEEDQLRYHKLSTFQANRNFALLNLLFTFDGFVASFVEHNGERRAR